MVWAFAAWIQNTGRVRGGTDLLGASHFISSTASILCRTIRTCAFKLASLHNYLGANLWHKIARTYRICLYLPYIWWPIICKPY